MIGLFNQSWIDPASVAFFPLDGWYLVFTEVAYFEQVILAKVPWQGTLIKQGVQGDMWINSASAKMASKRLGCAPQSEVELFSAYSLLCSLQCSLWSSLHYSLGVLSGLWVISECSLRVCSRLLEQGSLVCLIVAFVLLLRALRELLLFALSYVDHVAVIWSNCRGIMVLGWVKMGWVNVFKMALPYQYQRIIT